MTFFQAKALLNRISYKPNFRFSLNPLLPVDPKQPPNKEARVGAILHIFANFVDSAPECHNTKTDVCFSQTIHGEALHDFDEARFVRWIREAVLMLETHERDEWFRLDGKLVFDPHAPFQHGLLEIYEEN